MYLLSESKLERIKPNRCDQLVALQAYLSTSMLCTIQSQSRSVLQYIVTACYCNHAGHLHVRLYYWFKHTIDKSSVTSLVRNSQLVSDNAITFLFQRAAHSNALCKCTQDISYTIRRANACEIRPITYDDLKTYFLTSVITFSNTILKSRDLFLQPVDSMAMLVHVLSFCVLFPASSCLPFLIHRIWI